MDRDRRYETMVLRSAVSVYRNQGPRQLVLSGISFVSEVFSLPREPADYNGVEVLAGSPLYRLLGISPDRPTYEDGIVGSLRSYLTGGEDVVVVGGGWGVSTVVAAECVGETGHVYTYEGSKRNKKRVEETVRLNDVADRTTVRHAVVGEPVSLHGEQGGAERLGPNDLPDADVYVLDCEGSEIDILEPSLPGPAVIIVETHGMYDAPPGDVENILLDGNYEIMERTVADSAKRDFCQRKGIIVLTAVLSG